MQARRQTFNRILRDVIRANIRIKRGAPPRDIIPYKKHLLKLCLSRGTNLVEKRLALFGLPNGDWQRRDIQIWVPEGVDVDASRVADVVAAALQRVVTGTRMRVYRKDRWTGAADSMDFFLLLEGIHNLAAQTWPKFQAAMIGENGPIRRAGQPPVAPAGGRPVGADPGQSPWGPGGGGAHGEGAAGESAEASSEQRRASNDPAFYDTAAKDNENHRNVTAMWLDSSPFGRSLVLRQVMEPLTRLMEHHLLLGSSQWVRKEQAKEVHRFNVDDPREHRSYAVVELAKGALERECLADLSLLLHHDGFRLGSNL